MDQGKIVFRGTPGRADRPRRGHDGSGDAPLERGYSAVLAQSRTTVSLS